jgi:hypothetical protein
VVATNHDGVEEKFVKEEAKSYHIHLPCFVMHFIPGLVLTPLQWVLQKGKGRICMDCNGPDLTALPNTSIPKPSAHNMDKCQLVYYQHAFAHHLRHLWCTRISHPKEEILQHCDNIEAAFRQVLYHPNLVIVFVYIFGDFLIIQ